MNESDFNQQHNSNTASVSTRAHLPHASASASSSAATPSHLSASSSDQQPSLGLLTPQLLQEPPPLVVDPELENKVKKSCERISENLHICANEPSLALYRLAEHVRKALPPTVESRVEIRRLHQQLQGTYSDAENGLDTVRSMGRAQAALSNAQELLKNAIFLQQQIKYEQQRRLRKEPSMYQRLSAHISSVDIPDFAAELKETARETANRVESAFSLGSGPDPAGGTPKAHQPPSRAASVQDSKTDMIPKTQIARSQSVIGKVQLK